ncbi:MAG: hypothetical protein J0L92_33465 [Deltaproteobacteria bacterium]|nr:hypothetical protein [Deltaproteobacteria bacterium]
MSARLTPLALATIAMCLAGCPQPPSPAHTTLHELAAALRRGDAPAAYALMSSRYRERVPLEELARTMREQPEEIAATADALEHPLAIEEEARAHLATGEDVVLERGDEGWRVVTEVADYYARGTPRETIRSFVRAIEHRRYDVVLALLPAGERERLDEASLRAQWEGPAREEVERLVSALRQGLEASPIEQTGDRAVMPYGDRFRVVLVRESGAWCIEDPE